ncbi:MAG: DNA-binding protein [Sphingobacteriales bacterium]|nr:DNA-binding protein [Sphingobacteriales bacterium]
MKFVVLLLTIALFISCKSTSMPDEKLHVYAFRLRPGEDLKAGIEKAVRENNIVAGWVATGVGSLTDYSIRFANQPDAATGKGHFEIVSLTGTISVNGSHLHLSISDSSGTTLGGHLMPGCKIYTTAEIVLQSTGRYSFTREKDGSTPWEELQVKER